MSETTNKLPPVLKSFGKYLPLLQAVQLENEHAQVWEGQSLYPEVAKFLENNGFVLISFQLLRGIQSDSFWLRSNRMIL